MDLATRVRLAGHVDEAALSALYASGDIFAIATLAPGYGVACSFARISGCDGGSHAQPAV
ncbi:hypothetical protein [Rhodomicrobium lacus]|uniref:hypothetical protein n=1 Tax=Rhodomicrobium lacus TaxID=2498452 RepID=UPI0026E20380|nr:hypothetical protein [Rhodomicrobium lacus]WKW51411.1 hypothetical protein QMO75_02675 [Rhodomicrobium lacus]